MFRFTIRDSLWLIVVLAMIVAVWFERSARESNRRAVTHRASDQELEAISARYKAAKGEFDWHVTRWHSPGSERAFEYRWSVDDTCGAIERFAHATELENDPESKAKDLASALSFAQYLASYLMGKKDEYADVKTSPPFYRIQFTCADIEVRLRRAEQDLTAARQRGKDVMFRPTIRDLLWLIVAVVVGAALFGTRSQRDNGRWTATRRASDEELEAIRVRYEAAKGEFDYHATRMYGTGPGWSADQICEVIERFAEAAEARNDLEARVKDLASALNYAQREASATLDKYETDVEPADAVYRYQYTRADIEARLRRAERDFAEAQATR